MDEKFHIHGKPVDRFSRLTSVISFRRGTWSRKISRPLRRGDLPTHPQTEHATALFSWS